MKHQPEFSVDYDQLLAKIDVPLITRFIPIAAMKTVIHECHAEEKRLRRLPAWLIVLLCIMRGVYCREALSAVFAKVCLIPCLQTRFDLSTLPHKSALCLARYRLGVRPIAMLFKTICRPLATMETPGAFLYGFRLVALDGTFETIADTEYNAHYFGRHRTRRGREDSAFPQFQAFFLSECSTHVIFDAVITPLRSNQHKYFRRLLRSVTGEMLLMFDRGLYSYDSFRVMANRNIPFLTLARRDMKLEPVRFLSDGSFVAHIKSWSNGGWNDDPDIPVRVITYTLDDEVRNPSKRNFRLITSLNDPAVHDAMTLIETYHQRWEIEMAIDEIDTHQRLPWVPFRSQKPIGVIQEFYSLLLAYFVLCAVRHESAVTLGLPPQRLSFINTLRLIQQMAPLSQMLWGSHQSQLQDLINQWQDYFQLPLRDNRINPRVVKRKRNKFRRKKRSDKSILVAPISEVLRLV
jgi:hypothetical protein